MNTNQRTYLIIVATLLASYGYGVVTGAVFFLTILAAFSRNDPIRLLKKRKGVVSQPIIITTEARAFYRRCSGMSDKVVADNIEYFAAGSPSQHIPTYNEYVREAEFRIKEMADLPRNEPLDEFGKVLLKLTYPGVQ